MKLEKRKIQTRHSDCTFLQRLYGFPHETSRCSYQVRYEVRIQEAMLGIITSTMLSYSFPFWIHAIIETPASFNFFLFPSDQLGAHTPNAHAIVRQYACLLLASVLVSLSFVQRPPDALSGQVAGAFALYHLAASTRAGSRLQQQMSQGRQIVISEAFLHLLVHSVCFGSMWHHCWTFYLRFLGLQQTNVT